jgi:hypothetical protein
MKRNTLVLLAFGLMSFGLNAQSLRKDWVEKFRKIQPPNSKIIESTMPFYNSGRTNGGMDADTLNFLNGKDLVRQILWLNTNEESELHDIDSVRGEIEESYIKQNIIPITLVDYKYQAIHDSIEKINGITINAKDSLYEFKTGVGYHGSLYEDKYAFGVSFPLERIRTDFNRIVVDERLMLSNIALNPSGVWKLKIGNFQTDFQLNVPIFIPEMNDTVLKVEIGYVVPETDVRVGYIENPWPVSGGKTKILGRAEMPKNENATLGSNGSSGSGSSSGYYIPNDGFGHYPVTGNFVFVPAQKIWVETIDGFPGLPDLKALVTLDYGSENNKMHTCIKKPVVFIEGIDFGYKSYGFGERDYKCGTMGYRDMVAGKQWNVETQKYDNCESIAQAPEILKRYKAAGYDILYVDFYDGANDMDFNSETVIKVIQSIQSQMCGEKIHVVGVSMGSIVAKIALKKMERRKLSNCVASYTSFDGPHQGANIPLGLQRFVSYMSEVSDDSKFVLEKMLRRPAARQLLALHESVNAGCDIERRKLVRTDTLIGGFPSNMPLLAITNGSSLGSKGYIRKFDGNFLKPADVLVEIEFKRPFSKSFPWFWSTNVATIYAAHKSAGSSYFVAKMFGFFGGKSNFHSDKSNVQHDHINGSWNNAIGRVNDFGRMGNLFLKAVRFTDKTTFVNTVSALDLKFTKHANSKQNIHDMPLFLNPKSLLMPLGSEFSTPFERVFIPQKNQEHAYLDSSSKGNAMWLLSELNKVSDANHITVVDKNYNYRGPNAVKVKSLEVLNGAVFELNGLGVFPAISKDDSLLERTMEIHNYYSSTCMNSTYNVINKATFGIGNYKNGTGFTINSGGIFKLISGSKLRIRSGSKMILNEGSELNIGENCSLILDDKSQLCIESGAKIYLKRGSSIFLNGENAMLHVKGDFVLDSGVTFEPKSMSKMGLVKFTNVGYGYGDANIKALGRNVSMKFRGNGKRGNTNLQIEGKVSFPFQKSLTTYPIDLLNLDSCHVLFDGSGQLISGNNVLLNNSKFESVSWANGSGKGMCYLGDEIVVNKCDFSSLDTGLSISTKQTSRHNELSNNIFEECAVGLISRGRGMEITASQFTNNEVGAVFENLTEELIVKDCDISNNSKMGLNVKNLYLNSSFAFFTGTSFYKNYVSVKMEKQSLLSKCNVFSLNQIGIDIRNAKLYLGNKFYKFSDYLDKSVVAGNNAFLNQKVASIYMQEAMPFLDGGNNFIYTKTHTENKLQIYGTIVMDYNLPYWDNTFTKFNVNGNYWINNNKKYNIDSVDAHCVDVSYTSGGANIPLKLSGNVASRNQFLECVDPTKNIDFGGGLKSNVYGTDDKIERINLDLIKPVSDGFEIEGENVSVNVFNVSGQLVLKSVTKDMGTNFFRLSTGIYFIQVQNSEGISSKKIFVTN